MKSIALSMKFDHRNTEIRKMCIVECCQMMHAERELFLLADAVRVACTG